MHMYLLVGCHLSTSVSRPMVTTSRCSPRNTRLHCDLLPAKARAAADWMKPLRWGSVTSW